ncbi:MULTISPECIES: zinc-ribbon domain-containing protein [Cryobacterium]|uniref:Zinc-ribbon domain-containing protein n=1 Tax=Cryobacterium zongtaii TaxID=1259217 RepID=A0A2S3ZC12_9MICO|nr:MULTISPECIES: zinc-ribbon domain-containing protein [Cryobacterium]ASD23265.1 zinc-ribbon domain-containing protein [Cryobacterium sp. LW097]POH63392.1 zinc-ribbon domain-containing protein [Cryobacterium zongtaii]POH70907.1 zinc-ribbon domain-containing protein [Cryobacterium zongtaii]TFC47200.1 zinc-ribbon domain-containing protein [Cryobacterium sp. TMN-39-2]TFC52723.1 zinc-ribbon domain-containing protein [Cryobacterium sp. TMB3-1-2]
MFLLFGINASQKVINVVTFVCAFCGERAPQNVVKSANRFTVFFLPLFSFSTKYSNECTNCGGQTRLSADQARHSLDWVQSRMSS